MPSSRLISRYGPILGAFSNFGGGEWGAIGARHAAAGQFTGTNVMVYLDGSIGPRPGILDQTPGADTFGVPNVLPNGILAMGRQRSSQAVQWIIDLSGRPWSASYPNRFRWFHYDNPIALASPPVIDTVDDGALTFVTSYTQESYQLTHDTQSCTALPGSPGGRAITVFGEHLVVGGPNGAANQIRFSDPNNFDSWPALNFINMGSPQLAIHSLAVQRNILIVTFEDGSIFTISGTLGVNEVVRQFTASSPRTASLQATRVALTKRGVLWRRGRATAPESFDGTQLRALSYLDNWLTTTADDLAITGGADDDDVLFIGASGRLLMLHNAVWNKHELALLDTAPDSGQALGWYDGEQQLVIGSSRDDGTANIYVLPLALERPPMVALGDTVVDAGTGLTPSASFTLPEIRDSAGRTIAPRQVVVRFTKYDTGVAETNHFGVTVSVPDVYENTQQADLVQAPFDEDPSLASTAGIRQEKLFGLDTGEDGSSVSVTISDIRGVSIQEVVVYGYIGVDRSL